MSLKQLIFSAIPRSSQVRVRYAYRYISGQIDRELRLLRSLLDGRRRVVDVGAHHGIYSYGLLDKAAAVEAFEPLPDPYLTLASFGGRLHAHRVALSDHEGTGVLHVPHINGRPETGLASLAPGSGSQTTIEVPLHRLDGYEFRDDGFFLDTTNKVRSIREFRYERHQAAYLADLLNHEREYINNFVFVHWNDPRRARLQSA